MKISIRQNLIFFSLIILIVNGIIGYAVYKKNQKHLNSEQWVKHTEQVIYQSAYIQSLGNDIETASRGFVITNDSAFLEPLYSANITIFVYIRQLRELTKDNPVQQKRIDSLNFYIHKRLDYSLNSVELRSEKGLKSAIADASTRQGKQYSDHIREIISAIQQEEATLLKQRKQTNEISEATFNRVIMIMFISMDVFAMLLLLAFGNILLQNKEKEKRTVELIIAKDKAEESDRLKSAFLANMSHEIRTPMNGILGFAELLKRPDLTGEKQQQYISQIKKGGARMLNIINDIISISKVDSGQMEVSISETNVNEQIEYIYTFFKPEVQRKGMQISFHSSLSVNEANIKTDREKIYAILTNLVNNAIKYSDAGTIEFGYNLKAKKKPVENGLSESAELVREPKELEFFVKDTGIGIPQGKKKAIFERFIQAEIGDTRAYQGAGLGLSITKAYVELLGGKIWVESEEGKGSIFYFTIPYITENIERIAVENVVSQDEEINRIKKLKILIADDDESSAKLLKEIVKNYSKEVLYAETGVEAVEACQSNPDLDLVLMDIQMPVMDGLDATRQIRQFNTEVIIIAQTAYALVGDKDNAIEAGCNDYVPKPINQSLIVELITKHFNE